MRIALRDEVVLQELDDVDGQTAAAWVLQPTRSLSWAESKRIVLAIAVVSALIGGFFWALGLPLVLPFSGLEACAVAAAFYVVLRDGERREVITLAGERLVVERGWREPQERFEFNRHWVRVDLAPSERRHQPRRLLVGASGESVELGRFLTEGERESFARMLINALKKNS